MESDSPDELLARLRRRERGDLAGVTTTVALLLAAAWLDQVWRQPAALAGLLTAVVLLVLLTAGRMVGRRLRLRRTLRCPVCGNCQIGVGDFHRLPLRHTLRSCASCRTRLAWRDGGLMAAERDAGQT